jgi:gliding motility-associated-like protein
VTLDGSAAGTFADILTLTTNDLDEGNFVINLSGTITATPDPEIEVLAGTDPFTSGDTETLTSAVQSIDATQIFTINNTGTADLTIGSSLSDGSSYSVSSIASPIVAGGSTTFTVTLDGSAAGTFADILTLTTNDVDEGSFVINLSGTITAAPDPEIEVLDNVTSLTSGTGTIDLGTADEGANLNQSFTINNTGAADLTISGYSFTDGTTYSTTAVPMIIIAGGSTTIDVILDGSMSGTFTDVLTILSDDVDESNFTVNLTGTITATDGQDIVVTSGGVTLISTVSTINFVTSEQGIDVTQIITIENTGTNDLTITEIILADGTVFILDGLSFPITLAPGETLDIVITLNADSIGSFTDSITIVSNDLDDGNFVIGLNGDIIPIPVPDIEVRNNSSSITGVVEFLPSQKDDVASLTFEILNNGTANLNVSDITSSNATYNIANITLPNSIGVGGLSTFDLVLATTEVGVFTSTITISSDDPDQGNLTFDVRAVVEGAQVVIVITNPDNSVDRVIITNQDVDLGQTALNVNIVKVFGIENLSTSQDITVNNITVDNSVFEVLDFTSTVPVGGFIEFTIVLRATDAGQYSTNVTVSTSINNFSFRIIGEVSSDENADLNIYNIVTPNGDNVHDFFKIGNIIAYPDNQVIIYNRWGDKVFEISGYNNDSNMFLGVSNVGSNKELDEGNYYYAIDKGDGSKKETGFLFLKR